MGPHLRSKIIKFERIDSPNILVFVQGSWEVGDNQRNLAAAEKIRSEGIASVVLYESSRDWEALKDARTNEEWCAAFGDKTYQDELAELGELLIYVDGEHNPQEIFLSGSSYGGGLVALSLADTLQKVTSVLLSSPQIDCPTEARTANLYRDFPVIELFTEAVRRFPGCLRIIHPDQDDRVPIAQSQALYLAAETPDKRLIILPGDHTFRTNLEGYVAEHIAAFR